MNAYGVQYCQDHPVLLLLGIMFVGYTAGAVTYRLNSQGKPMYPAKSLVAAAIGSGVGYLIGGKPGLAAGAFALIAHDRIHDRCRAPCGRA